jgi:hypothetical protein
MILKPEEAEQFYRIWWPLLSYVNQKRQIVDDWPIDPLKTGVKFAQAIKVREVLWTDSTLREQFIEENPSHLSTEDLEILAQWTHPVRGNFTVLRHLKKYSIFLGQGQKAYGVVGLLSTLEELLPHAPAYVTATLLPFKDRIIYDGLLTAPNIMLGSGIRSRLNDEYQNAQESFGLITSLPQSNEAMRAGILQGNARLLKVFRANLAGAGLSDKMLAKHLENVEGLAETLFHRESPEPLLNLDLPSARVYIDTHPSATTSLKRFVRFLFETGRGDWERTEELQVLRQRG